MTITVPSDLEQAVQQKAAERRVSVDQFVHEALEWYLRIDTNLVDELTAWQEIRDEAYEVAEGTSL